MAGADVMLGHVERRGAFVRTGHHSASSGEFRDAAGFVAAKFLQHTSRSGDPQLHVQVPILNRAQRADGADERWRALDGRPLWAERLGASRLCRAGRGAGACPPRVSRWSNGKTGTGSRSAASSSPRWTRSAPAPPTSRSSSRSASRNTRRCSASRRTGRRCSSSASGSPSRPARPSTSPAPPSRATRRPERARPRPSWPRGSGKRPTSKCRPWKASGKLSRRTPPSTPKRGRWGCRPPPIGREIIRAAVAEVQRQNAAWTRAKLEWELYRQLPVLPRWADWGRYLSDMADDALSGRAEGVNVIQIAPVPDVVDVSRLGFRKDGASVYRPPGEARYVTAQHLDLEEWLLSTAKAAAAQRVTAGAAAAALAALSLELDQRAAAQGLLTSERAVSVLVAPAGTGKTYTMAQFAKVWTEQAGGRVIGLTLAENAARVMAGEGMSEAHNIARVLRPRRARRPGRRPGGRRGVAGLHRRPRADRQPRPPGGRAGDPDRGRRAARPGRGGRDVPADRGRGRAVRAGRGPPVRARAGSARRACCCGPGIWPRGSGTAPTGGCYEGPQDRVHDDAVDFWLTDIARGKASLLLAATNEEAARLAGLARERRIERGQIPGGREITLRDGNPASRGDLVRARLNRADIDAGGQPLANRDVIRITGWQGEGAGAGGHRAAAARAARRRTAASGRMSSPSRPPTSRRTRELAYAGNVFVAQGRTVDTAHLVVSEGMTRDLLYVGMTRGRERNVAHVVTGPPDPADLPRAGTRRLHPGRHPARGRAARPTATPTPRWPSAWSRPNPRGCGSGPPWESVIAAAMERDEPTGTAIEAMRHAADFPVNLRHLYEIKRGVLVEGRRPADRRHGPPAYRRGRLPALPQRPRAARVPPGAAPPRDRRPAASRTCSTRSPRRR